MASNVAVKITADVIDLQAKFAIAKAESGALNSELNKLGRQAAQAGGQMSAELKASLTQAAEASVKAKAEVAALNAEMKSGQSSSRVFSQGLGLMKEGLAALGITASIGAVVEFGKAVEENAAHLAHQAQVLQLSVTAYQAFREAAIDSGVGTDEADTAIQRFSKNVSEAAVGTGPAAKALVEMGISASQSKEQILQQVSAFLVHTDAVTRDRYATELFGRSGAELMPLFGQWAQGVDNLSNKYQTLGRMLSPEVAEAAEKADIKMQGAWEHLKVEAAPAVVFITDKLADLVDMLGRVRVGAASLGSLNIGPLGLSLADQPKPSAPVKPPAPKAPSEKDEVAALNAIDGKMRERIDLEKELSIAKKTAADARAAGDSKGLAQANEVINDLQKQLNSLNKAPSDPNARKAAEEKRRELHELEEDAKQISSELDEEARSDASRNVALAKQEFEQKKTILADEFAAHKITAQQKYDATVEALNKEAQAERAAQQQIINSSATTAAQKHEALNQEVEIDAETNAKIIEAHRQLTAELKQEDQKRLESWRSVDSAITGAEGQLVSDIFTKRQGLGRDLAQIGEKMLEQEVADDLKALTEHELVNLGMLASDKATSQEGLLFKLGSYLLDQSGLVSSEATKTAAAVATNEAQVASAAGLAGANGVASFAGAPWPIDMGAPGFGASMAAAAASFGAFAQGVNVVPQDMIAQIHAGERIMPAADNRAIMSAVNGGGKGGGDVHLNYHAAPSQNANHETDARDMVRIFQRAVRSGAIKFS